VISIRPGAAADPADIEAPVGCCWPALSAGGQDATLLARAHWWPGRGQHRWRAEAISWPSGAGGGWAAALSGGRLDLRAL